jgi:predicted permease
MLDGGVLLDNAGRLAVLAVPVLLGVLVGRVHLVRDVGATVDGLNVYTLYVGFPALIAVGVVGVAGGVASQWGFWAVVPIVDLALVLASLGLAKLVPDRQAGTMALVGLFGNTAYLGIPFAVSVLGASARGPATLLVAVQVAIAVAVGPVLLTRWSGDHGTGVDWGRVLRQPLLWSPLMGLVVRSLPAGPQGAVLDVLGPLAASTAPVAMFLLGLYLYRSAARVRSADAGIWLHVALRLLLAPAVSWGVGEALVGVGALDASALAVVVLLGGMPAAIATFSLAHHADVGPDRVASVVVRSSVASAVTLPLLATLAGRLH